MRRFAHPQVLVAVGLIALALYAVRHTLGSTTLVLFAVVVPSIILHELAHGVTALAFGDDTARRAGRLTLNPARHIDPLGTLVLPGVLALAGLGAFGYAKPVPINPSHMRHPRNNALVVSLAGPATNLALAGLSVLLLRWARPAGTARAVNFVVATFGVGALSLPDRVLYLLGFVNVSLAAFNALPIPPLDGSAVVGRLLPPAALPAWYTFQRYAMPVLLLVVLLHPGNFLDHLFGPAERAWARLLSA
jgi:Zn-dependent protease